VTQTPGGSASAGSRPLPGAPTPGGHTAGGHTPGAQAGRAVQPQLPGYELLGELGRGAHGAVLRARELQTGRQVALKVLLGSRLEPTHAERFRREGELTARLDHPGIVRVHGDRLRPMQDPRLW
jgi:serine/threonine protein kinase